MTSVDLRYIQCNVLSFEQRVLFDINQYRTGYKLLFVHCNVFCRHAVACKQTEMTATLLTSTFKFGTVFPALSSPRISTQYSSFWNIYLYSPDNKVYILPRFVDNLSPPHLFCKCQLARIAQPERDTKTRRQTPLRRFFGTL